MGRQHHHHPPRRNVHLGHVRIGERDELRLRAAGEADLQQIAGAEVLHGDDLADALSGRRRPPSSDQVRVVEFALGCRAAAASRST